MTMHVKHADESAPSCGRDTRSLMDRVWSRLGFGHPHVEPPEELDGWAASYMVTGTVIVADWYDRIRFLVSGKAEVRIQTKTDVIVSRMQSASAFSVLPPNFPDRAARPVVPVKPKL